jgi:hypothetical protein
MRLLFAAVLMLFTLTPANGQQRAAFTVGTATATSGQMARGTIEVPAGSDAALSIPVALSRAQHHDSRPQSINRFGFPPGNRRLPLARFETIC